MEGLKESTWPLCQLPIWQTQPPRSRKHEREPPQELRPLFRQHLKAGARETGSSSPSRLVRARIGCLAVLGLGGASSLAWFERRRCREGGCRTRGALSRRIRNSWTRFVSGCSGGGSRTRGTWVRCGVVGRAVEGRAVEGRAEARGDASSVKLLGTLF